MKERKKERCQGGGGDRKGEKAKRATKLRVEGPRQRGIEEREQRQKCNRERQSKRE